MSKTSILEAGYRLIAQYCPDLQTFKPVVSGSKKYSYHTFDDSGTNGSVLRWRVADGLDTLMHEIGHHVLRHGNNEEVPTFRDKIMWEVDAWLWAEKKCRAHGFKFGYEEAERDFRDYFKERRQHQLVTINWRYQHD